MDIDTHHQIQHATPACQSICSTRLRVTSVSDRPPESGYVQSWVLVRAEDSRGDAAEFYILFRRQDQPLPPVGGLCSFEYRQGRVEGLISGREGPALLNAAIVERADCLIDYSA